MLGKGNTKGSMVGHRWSLLAEKVCFSFSGDLKLTLVYGKGGIRRFPSNNQ
jgi:hypothetical protein